MKEIAQSGAVFLRAPLQILILNEPQSFFHFRTENR